MGKYLGRSETDVGILERVREALTFIMYISIHTFQDERWTTYPWFKQQQKKNSFSKGLKY